MVTLTAGCKVKTIPTPVVEEPQEEPTLKTTAESTPTVVQETLYPVAENDTVPPLPQLSLQSISFFTKDAGWGLTNERKLVRTSDGGNSWLDVTPESALITDAEFGPRPILEFLDDQTAWYALSDFETSTLFYTQDAGSTWQTTELPFSVAAMDFINANDGFILSDLGVAAGSQYVAVLQTADSGLTWQQRFSHEPGMSKELPESGIKSGIAFMDASKGWIGGSEPVTDSIYLFRTLNSGQYWNVVDINIPVELTGSFFESFPPIFTDTLNGYLPVRVLDPSGKISLAFFHTVDAGETWTYASSLPDSFLFDFEGSSAGIAGSQTALYLTSDGAQTWQDLTNTLPSGQFLLEVEILDGETAWILTVPDLDDSSPHTLYKTEDGGNNWQSLTLSIILGSN